MDAIHVPTTPNVSRTTDEDGELGADEKLEDDDCDGQS
jgi:hypothetical protein